MAVDPLVADQDMIDLKMFDQDEIDLDVADHRMMKANNEMEQLVIRYSESSL